MTQLVCVFAKAYYTVKVLTVVGVERDVRSVDKKCLFLKRIGFWLVIYVFRFRNIQDLRRIEN